MTEANLYIQAVERSIGKLVKNWQALAFNLHSEADVGSCLHGYLRAEESLRVACGLKFVELVHAEFPVRWSGKGVKGRYDLVIWEPAFMASLDEHALNELWGAQHDERALTIPLLVAIEIKHLRGGTQWLKGLSSRKTIMQHHDIRKLLGGQAKYCYFLAFSDEDLEEKEECKGDLESVQTGLESVARETGFRLRILCVSRDGWITTPGFSTK